MAASNSKHITTTDSQFTRMVPQGPPPRPRHVGVAPFPVKNRPETGKRRRPSSRTAAGWCFARPHAEERRSARRAQALPQPKRAATLPLMLRSIAARRGRRCFAGQRALRCVSKHEGGSQSLVPILRDARTRPRSLRKFSGMRAPQDEDEHRVLQSSPYKQPFSFPRRIFAPEVLHPCFTHPRVEGWAERRETFGCSAEHP
jgi:hypothetical protein